MTEVRLSVENLSIEVVSGLSAGLAVGDVSFDLHAGQTLALVGESGCGKTMTALALMRLLPTAARIVGGRIMVDDYEVLRLSPRRLRALRGQKIAYVSQEPHGALNPVMSIGKQIGEVFARRGIGGRASRTRVVDALSRVGIADPERRLNSYPHELSGGMKQRVAIAMALAGEPDVLIADEPTTALDVTIQAQILALLRRVQSELGMSMLLITHDLGVVREMADTVAVMYRGQLVEKAGVNSLLGDPLHPYTRALLAAVPSVSQRGRPLATIPGFVPPIGGQERGCPFQPRCRFAWEQCEITNPPLLAYRSTQAVRCNLYQQVPVLTPSAPTSDNVPVDLFASGITRRSELLSVTSLSVVFPMRRPHVFERRPAQLTALTEISFGLRKGETLAVVGESGCGKSTLAKAIVGLVAIEMGEVLFEGRQPHEHSGFRSGVQMIFQDSFASLNPRMSVGRIIAEGMLAQRVGGTRRIRRDVAQLLDKVGLPGEYMDRFPSQLSGGQRQRVCIARALAVEPKVLICDEPTSALDVSVQAQILNLLTDLQTNLGLTLLIITHDLSVVSYLADEVLVMYLGRVVERGVSQELMANPKHPYTRMLLDSAPDIHQKGKKLPSIVCEELPSPMSIHTGCAFRTRCSARMGQCSKMVPQPSPFSATHSASCFLYPQPAREMGLV